MLDITFNDVVITGETGFCSSIADDYMSYRLGNNSICRESGTPDTTGLFLPELDLYGNLRMFGTAIDIGCNEWSYPVALQDDYLLQPELLTAYPNPFHGSTTLCFDLPKAGNYELSIYNIRGQLVKTMRDEGKNSGRQESLWDGCDLHGQHLPSGVYLVQLKTGEGIKTGKITLIR